MYLISFAHVFPYLAEKNTKSFSITDHDKIPAGVYCLYEMYCPDYDCNCYKVDILILRIVRMRNLHASL